jgi:hypothetical protein
MIGILLYVLAGIVFGYAMRGVLGWLFPLAIVALFGLGTIAMSGLDDFRPAVFVLALLLTAGGVVLGRLLADRFGGATTGTTRASA